MKKFVELLVITIVVVLASAVFNRAFASDHCADVTSLYQAAASLRDANVTPNAALHQLQRYTRVSNAERIDAVLYAWRHRYQSQAQAYRAGLAQCEDHHGH